MGDVYEQVKMCKRNHLPPLLYVVSFGTTCLGLLLEAREPVTDASQDSDLKLQNSTVAESYLLFASLVLSGSDKLKTIYHFRVVTILMALAPAHQAGWLQVFTKHHYFKFSFKSEALIRLLV